MNSGKSQELLRVDFNYKSKDERVVIFVPDTDDRFGVGKVTTRAGQSTDAIAVTPGQMREYIKNSTLSVDMPACILVDEVQFFTRDDIFALKELTVYNEIPVIAYGLKTDFLNNLFEGSQACLVVAEDIKEIETVCKYCNNKAIMNLRLTEDGTPAKEGEQVVIGSSQYVSVCHFHWNN